MVKKLTKLDWLELVKINIGNISNLPQELVSDVDFMNEVIDLANMHCLDYTRRLRSYRLGKNIVEHNVSKRTKKIGDMIKAKFDEIGDDSYIAKSASIDISRTKEMDITEKACLYLSRYKKSKVVFEKDVKKIAK